MRLISFAGRRRAEEGTTQWFPPQNKFGEISPMRSVNGHSLLRLFRLKHYLYSPNLFKRGVAQLG